MSHEFTSFSFAAAVIVAISGLLCTGLILLTLPWLKRNALVKPTEESFHREPTPQGGGIAVIAATIATSLLAPKLPAFHGLDIAQFEAVFMAVLVIAALGIFDDCRPLPVLPRLIVQTLTLSGLVYTLPPHWAVLAPLPLWFERPFMVLAGVWFLNLMNFMDGIDWMIVAEVVPLATAMVAIGIMGVLPPDGIVLALALAGAILAFACFNRPAAKLLLGDAGSLPIGLILGWLLLLIAAKGHLLPAILMPLYYLVDATFTLLRRAAGRDYIFRSHRTHFYQLAVTRGYSVIEVVCRVFLTNLCLCGLSIFVIITPSRSAHVAAVFIAAGLIGWLLFTFERGKSKA
jgi:UDP-N-acetylmuramyl pentapeptide phosphotransferase/UDP-N-acetylglucosamine-1-phosphate transferase